MKDKSAVSDCKYTPHYHRDRSNVTKINITDYGKDPGLTAEVRSIVHGNNCVIAHSTRRGPKGESIAEV